MLRKRKGHRSFCAICWQNNLPLPSKYTRLALSRVRLPSLISWDFGMQDIDVKARVVFILRQQINATSTWICADKKQKHSHQYAFLSPSCYLICHLEKWRSVKWCECKCRRRQPCTLYLASVLYGGNSSSSSTQSMHSSQQLYPVHENTEHTVHTHTRSRTHTHTHLPDPLWFYLENDNNMQSQHICLHFWSESVGVASDLILGRAHPEVQKWHVT